MDQTWTKSMLTSTSLRKPVPLEKINKTLDWQSKLSKRIPWIRAKLDQTLCLIHQLLQNRILMRRVKSQREQVFFQILAKKKNLCPKTKTGLRDQNSVKSSARMLKCALIELVNSSTYLAKNLSKLKTTSVSIQSTRKQPSLSTKRSKMQLKEGLPSCTTDKAITQLLSLSEPSSEPASVN